MSSSLEAVICGLVFSHQGKRPRRFRYRCRGELCCGGHALTSGGHVHLGAGTSLQKRMGCRGLADPVLLDHTSPLAPEARYNIREVVRGAADAHAAAFDFLLGKRVGRTWTTSTLRGGGGTDSVNRTIHPRNQRAGLTRR